MGGAYLDDGGVVARSVQWRQRPSAMRERGWRAVRVAPDVVSKSATSDRSEE